MIEDAITAHRVKLKDMPSHNEGITTLRFIGLLRRSGGVRLNATMVIWRFWLSALIIVIAAAGLACRRAEPSGANRDSQAGREITVSAAVRLRDAFREISKQDEERKGAKINFNFRASGALQQKKRCGAPVYRFAGVGVPQ